MYLFVKKALQIIYTTALISHRRKCTQAPQGKLEQHYYKLSHDKVSTVCLKTSACKHYEPSTNPDTTPGESVCCDADLQACGSQLV